MDTAEFLDLVEDFREPRAVDKGFGRSTSEFTTTLCKTFRLTCGLGGGHGEFGAGIESLQVIDEWCRLHLTEKFFARYEAALGSDAELS